MRTFLFLGFVMILFGSCNREETIIHIRFEHSQGLQAGNDLIMKGVKIGEVKSVELTRNYTVLASVQLSDSIQLPRDSPFTIGNKDLFTKAILVEEGDSKVMIEHADTIRGKFADNLLEKFDLKNSNPLEGIDKILQ